MPLPKRKTWFLIADGAKARLFESKGPNAPWNLLKDKAEERARMPDRDLGRDRPARGRNIGTGAPFAIDEPSKHDKAEEEFLVGWAKAINEAKNKNEFDQLVLAAPPSALGTIRKKLSANVIEKIVGVFDKDLTNLDDQDLHAYFKDKLEFW